jgi:hypothetical protein
MKQVRIYPWVIAVLFSIGSTFCSCSKQEIPNVLKEHKDKALFTKVNEGNIQIVPLFNGKDLSGWYTYTEKYGKNKDEEKEFQVEDGVLHFDGETMGYLCTSDSYRDYYLRIVFRWGEKKYPPRLDSPRDSGVLYHFSECATDELWPTSIECQIQENDCGDYWFIGGTHAKSSIFSQAEGTLQRIPRTANYENPNSWNTIEVICIGDKSEHYVNGRQVNEAYDLSVSEGKILLQMECAEIFYKTVELLLLK